MPIYNVEKYIEKCARSLFEQTLDDIEYIFVNDCTPDKSISILKQALKEYPHRQQQVKIISHQTNMGSAAARNTCLSAATGEYIGWCDSDDWIEDNMFECMYLKAKETNADIVCCNYITEYQHKQINEEFTYLEETKQILQDSKPTILNSSLCNKIIRKTLYEQNDIRPYDGINMNEDLGMTIRLRYLSCKTLIIPQAFYHYNRLNLSSMIATPKLKFIEESIECARLLSDWFAQKSDGYKYEKLLCNIKFMAKAGLIAQPYLSIFKQWKKIFPETNKDIWQHKELNFITRLVMWLSLHHCSNIIFYPYQSRKFIQNFIRTIMTSRSHRAVNN